jgi:hypothetical protein
MKTREERAAAWKIMLAYVKTLPDVLGSYQNRAKALLKMAQRKVSDE